MKNPLQSLLIVFAIGLCGLCTWQWFSQMRQQNQLNALAQSNYDQTVAIQGYTNSLNAADHEIAQLDARLTELRDGLKSNTAVLFAVRADHNRLTAVAEQYSNAVVVLESQLKQANEIIHQQNAGVKHLVQERDEYVSRLNQSIKDRNALVTQYNALVKQVEVLQAAQSPKQSPP